MDAIGPMLLVMSAVIGLEVVVAMGDAGLVLVVDFVVEVIGLVKMLALPGTASIS